MTEIEIIDKQIASLTDRLDRATARIEALVIERQSLGYDLHVLDSKEAKMRLGQLAQEVSRLHEEKDTLAGAIVEARRRLTAAQNAVARDVAAEHRRAALATLESFGGAGPQARRARPPSASRRGAGTL
jgi:chromosome segregation ATPase